MDSSGDPWDAFWRQVDALQAALRRSTAAAVNSASVREMTRRLVQDYFRTIRPSLIDLGLPEESVADLDGPLQELLRLSNGRNRRTTYQNMIRRLRTARSPLDVERERLYGLRHQARPAPALSNSLDRKIIATLAAIVPSAARSYQQAVTDLTDDNRMSFRGTACELREALREVLDHLAPDSEVTKAPGFKLEKNASRPTMKQKARFILRARGYNATALQTPGDAVDRIESASASLARSVYSRGSLSTHVATTKEEVLHLKMYVDSILAELLQIHGESRNQPHNNSMQRTALSRRR